MLGKKAKAEKGVASMEMGNGWEWRELLKLNVVP